VIAFLFEEERADLVIDIEIAVTDRCTPCHDRLVLIGNVLIS